MNTAVRIASLFLMIFFLTPLNTVKQVVSKADMPVRQAQIESTNVQIIEMAVMMPHQTADEPAKPYIAPKMNFNH